MSSKRRLKNLTIIMLLVLGTSLGTVFFPQSAQADSAAAVFDIIEITDFHGTLESTSGSNTYPVAAVLAANVKQIVAANPDRTLILANGDNYQGSAVSNLQYGIPVMKVFNSIGVEASALGNHEFDWGLDKVSKNVEAKYPLICANLYNKGTTTPALLPYKIFAKDGVKIGVIGAVTETTPGIVLYDYIKNYDVGQIVPAVNQAAADARAEGAQIVIALIHEGITPTSPYNSGPLLDIANQLTGVDAVLGGHSHVYAQLTASNGIPVVEGNCNGKGFIDLKLTRAADGKLTFNTNNSYVAIDTTSTAYPYGYKAANPTVDAAVSQIVSDTKADEGPILNEVLGSVAIDLTRTQSSSPYGESLAGNWATDVTRAAGNADFGFQNNGGLRCDISHGPITMATLYTFMPFDNTVVTCDMTGNQIKTVLEQAVQDGGKGIQVSGLTFTYDPNLPSGSRILSINKNDGNSIDFNDQIQTYKVATNNFMAGGGDGFAAFTRAANMIDTNILIRDALANAIKTAGASGVTASIEGRIDQYRGEGVKNIIMLIGDGMGYDHIKAARDATTTKHLAMDDVNNASGRLTTRSADNDITDSAPAATALASGYKTNNNWIGLTPDKTLVPTILELANQENMATGLVTTTQICHATPAGFASHVINRNMFNTIAAQYFDNFAAKGKPLNVLMGAGANNFNDRHGYYNTTGKKCDDQNDTRNLIEEFKAQGYSFANDASSLMSINAATSHNLLGLFGPNGGMTQERQRQNGNTEPHLVDMTQKALEALATDPDGFFLMVEGGQIDWAAHANDFNNTVGETLAFDKCVKAALEFQATHPGTLIVVTADHETGGLSYTDPTHYTWSSGDHTAAMVPVMAKGSGASVFNGTMDNTEIPRKMAAILGLNKPLVVQYRGNTVGQPTTFTVTSMGLAVSDACVTIKDSSKDNLTMTTLTTDASGQASYTFAKVGSYIISAAQDGYINSQPISITSAAANVGATIKNISVLDSTNQPISGPLTRGKQYYLNWKANKNSAGSLPGLAIVEALDAANQATFLNAVRLQVMSSPDTDYSALFQPGTSGTFKLKGLFWTGWSNTADWQSLADPAEVTVIVN